MAVADRDSAFEIDIIARTIARRAAPFPPERRRYIIGPAISGAATRRFAAEPTATAAAMVDFIDALTMAVFDEIDELDRQPPD